MVFIDDTTTDRTQISKLINSITIKYVLTYNGYDSDDIVLHTEN